MTIKSTKQDWVPASKSGYHPNYVMNWRKAGRLVEGKDCQQIHSPGTKQTWFYRPGALAREFEKDRAARVRVDRSTPTVRSIEKSGQWVTGTHSDPGRGTIGYWLSLGLIPAADILKIEVQIIRSTSGSFKKLVTFYRVATLKRLGAKDWNDSRAKKALASRKRTEERVIEGIQHWRIGRAAKYLGMARAPLRSRVKEFGAFVEIVLGRETHYFPVPKLIEFKQRQSNVRERHDGEVAMAEACRISGRSEDTLRDKRWCIENDIGQRKSIGVKGRSGRHVEYFFIEADLIRFATRRAVEMPADRMTASEAATVLRCTPGTIGTLCREKILDAIWGDVPGGKGGKREGWLPTRASVSEARSAIRKAPNRIRAGWMLRKWAKDRAAQPPTPIAISKQSAGYTVAVDDTYKPGGCVRVAGQLVRPVSFGTWKLLNALAKARAIGKGVDKGELESLESNPYRTLDRFVKRFPDAPTVVFPGGKAKGGYKLL